MKNEDRAEVWMPVPSKPEVMASSMGRVLLPNVEYAMPNGGTRRTNPKPTFGTKTKASKTAKHIYMGILSRRFGNMKVHRLVCEAFHGVPPTQKMVVIHLDEDATNNRPENLRWGTQKENMNAPGFIDYCKSRTGKNSPVVKGRLKRNSQMTV